MPIKSYVICSWWFGTLYVFQRSLWWQTFQCAAKFDTCNSVQPQRAAHVRTLWALWIWFALRVQCKIWGKFQDLLCYFHYTEQYHTKLRAPNERHNFVICLIKCEIGDSTMWLAGDYYYYFFFCSLDMDCNDHSQCVCIMFSRCDALCTTLKSRLFLFLA